MTIDVKALIQAVTDHAMLSGHFDSVQGHEPKSAPGNGLTYAVFLSAIGPARNASGLSETSARVELTGRIYTPFLKRPEDDIDPGVAVAVDDLMEAYSADFDLGGRARNVDLLGASGVPLGGRAGYQKIGDSIYRVFDLTIPIVVNDAWNQEG
jgi:hypothetical protein